MKRVGPGAANPLAAQASWSMAAFASTFAWATTTPRGVPVEPLVYCKSATSPAATGSPTPGSFPGVLVVGNPELKPWLAENFDLSAEYYTETGGVLSFGVYRKQLADFHTDITGITATPALLAQLGMDPGYDGWEVRTTVNGGDARVDGMEANIRQSLAPLGTWGRMFSVFANGTRLRLLGSAGGRSSFSRFIPKSANWGVTITRRPVTLMLKWNHRGEQRQGASAAQGPDAFLFQAKRTTTDINLTWQLHRYVSLFVNGRNIFNVHYNLMRYGSQTPGYAKVSSTNSYGAQWSFPAAQTGATPRDALLSLAFGWSENMVQAAMKAVPLGQAAAQRMLARLAAAIPAAVDDALALGDDGRQVATPMLAILSAQHEQQYSRLFRS